MSINTAHKIFFYCYPQGPPHQAAFQHSIICLAEGLKELGVPFYANINYWQIYFEKNQYLFSYNQDVQPDDCSVVIVNHQWMRYGKCLPADLFKKKRKYLTVYIDSADGRTTASWRPEFRQFDIILKCHFNRKWRYPDNLYPWAFGISNRIKEYTSNYQLFLPKKDKIIFNYRVNHGVRDIAIQKFLPSIAKILEVDSSVDHFAPPQLSEQDYLWWTQTGRRHYPNYYTRLKSSVACACFGGYLDRPLWHDYTPPYKHCHRALNKLFPKTMGIVLQWDSWRFWESLAAGCVAFHVDFEKYGIQLPVMPLNYRHYIGIDLDDPEIAVKQIFNDPELLAKIAVEGRAWAFENYSPVPTAKRFLEMVN